MTSSAESKTDYDPSGKKISSADAVYDANGNLTSLSATTYGFRENPPERPRAPPRSPTPAYDANGMQVGSTEIRTSYDANGQQTSSVGTAYDADGQQTSFTTIVYEPVYDGDAVVGYTETTSTYDGDGTLSSSSSTVVDNASVPRLICQQSGPTPLPDWW
jgi:hypothetical protein